MRGARRAELEVGRPLRERLMLLLLEAKGAMHFSVVTITTIKLSMLSVQCGVFTAPFTPAVASNEIILLHSDGKTMQVRKNWGKRSRV